VKAGGKRNFHADFSFLFFDPADRGDMFLRNVGLTFNRLHGVIFQKIELFIKYLCEHFSSYMALFQNYWVLGLCSSSGILETRKHNVSETGSVSVLR
jgi:hypothetical protein